MITEHKRKAFREDLLEELYLSYYFPEEFMLTTRITEDLNELFVYTRKAIESKLLLKTAKRHGLTVIGYQVKKENARKYKYYLEVE